MSVLPASMSMHHVHEVPMKDRRGHCIPWNWSYRWLWATVWELGIKCSILCKSSQCSEPSLQPYTNFQYDSASSW